MEVIQVQFYSSTVSGEAGTKVVVIDDLETSSKDKALSANMGKYLNENKQDKNEYVDTINQVFKYWFWCEILTLSLARMESLTIWK